MSVFQCFNIIIISFFFFFLSWAALVCVCVVVVAYLVKRMWTLKWTIFLFSIWPIASGNAVFRMVFFFLLYKLIFSCAFLCNVSNGRLLCINFLMFAVCLTSVNDAAIWNAFVFFMDVILLLLVLILEHSCCFRCACSHHIPNYTLCTCTATKQQCE